MTAPLRILLVEDDLHDRQFIRTMLSRGNREVELACVGTLQEGTSQLVEMEYDCALVDLNLPDGDGLEIVHANPSLPIVVLTSDDKVQSERAISRGVQDYLVKGSFNAETLLRVIRYAIEGKQVEELRERLWRAGRLVSLGRVAGGVAHEINNPNTFVLANLRVLQDLMGELGKWVEQVQSGGATDGRDDAKAVEIISECQEIVSEALEGSRRVSNIVRQLQDLGSHDSVASFEKADLNRAVRSAVKHFHNTWELTIELDLDEGLPMVSGEQARVGQLITQLLLNALQAAFEKPSSGRVFVSTETVGEQVQLVVGDTGPGIPFALHRRVFEPFFTTRGFEGSLGLGLAIVSEIVQECGGSIHLTSKPDKGTRICVLFAAR